MRRGEEANKEAGRCKPANGHKQRKHRGNNEPAIEMHALDLLGSRRAHGVLDVLGLGGRDVSLGLVEVQVPVANGPLGEARLAAHAGQSVTGVHKAELI